MGPQNDSLHLKMSRQNESWWGTELLSILLLWKRVPSNESLSLIMSCRIELLSLGKNMGSLTSMSMTPHNDSFYLTMDHYQVFITDCLTAPLANFPRILTMIFG